LIIYPNAKINIGLKVLNKRPDGYHNLESVMIPVPWYDALEIIPASATQTEQVRFSSSGLAVPGNAQDNLCVRAYDLLKNHYDLPPVQMHLHKVVPMGAGLGGGSSDGAFTLKALNSLFKLGIPAISLKKYAAVLGSDCPFFIDNTPAFVYSRGEKMKRMQFDAGNLFIVIIYPGLHIGTADAYRNIIRGNSEADLRLISTKGIRTWKKKVENHFENHAIKTHPIIGKIKSDLYKSGALYASMTGSGSSVYGLFPNEIKIPSTWKKHLVFKSPLKMTE
jgi:4-diphosphocytidyl-2-C-methyl-D-erythritol kinase